MIQFFLSAQQLLQRMNSILVPIFFGCIAQGINSLQHGATNLKNESVHPSS